MRKFTWLSVPVWMVAISSVLQVTPVAAGQYSNVWLSAGQNPSNTRSQPSEIILNSSNVSGLYPLWIFTAGGAVTATPTVTENDVYFPDWAGNIFAVDRSSGKQIWSKTVATYSGVAGDLTRVSPTVVGDELIFGDSQSRSAPHQGAYLIAVNRFNGALLWKTQIESHPAATVTGSAVAYNGVVYQGVSSAEEGLAELSNYACCTFRGSMVAVDATTGQLLWQTYLVPDNQGVTGQYSGGAIWQSPVVDPVRGLLYVGTGNNYTAPASARACQTANPQATNCMAADDYFDSALALNLSTGAIRWSHRLWGYDVDNLACRLSPPGPSCQTPVGPDYDMSSGGNLLSGIVGFGQKTGIYWAFDPEIGTMKWETMVGPAGNSGGIEWGTATDGKRIYVANSNSAGTSHILPSGQTITWGWWSAVDPSTGNILWETADPTNGAFDIGAVSVANGVMYAGSLSGQIYALNATNGAILWSYNSGGSVIDGPAIADGVLYWGSGVHSGGTANNKVYAFTIPPGAQVSASTLNYGTIAFPGTETKSLTVTNIGQSSLNVSPSINGPSYIVSENTCTAVVAGASCTLQIEFNPVDVGSHDDLLTLKTNGLTNPVVQLDGRAVAMAASASQRTLAANHSASLFQ